MTAAEVEREFGIPQPTIYRLVRQRRIPFVDVSKAHHVQRHVLFRRAEIQTWQEERTRLRAGEGQSGG